MHNFKRFNREDRKTLPGSTSHRVMLLTTTLDFSVLFYTMHYGRPCSQNLSPLVQFASPSQSSYFHTSTVICFHHCCKTLSQTSQHRNVGKCRNEIRKKISSCSKNLSNFTQLLQLRMQQLQINNANKKAEPVI